MNVGQGDCAIIGLPYRKKVYVIDTGGLLRFDQDLWKQSKVEFEIGRKIVVPYIKGRGIRSIDTMILTHADADHVEGAEEVMEEIRVKEIHVTPNSWKKNVMQDVIQLINSKKIPLREKMVAMNWREGDVYFDYLSPADTHYEGNDDSLVLLLRYGKFKILFTGDLEAPGELRLVNKKIQSIENITILKAWDHGSKTSSSEPFLAATNPVLTVFSTGLNRYGHPSKEVVERYEQLGLKTLNTAEVGQLK